MNKKSVKAFIITSCVFALAGIACFVVKLIEATMRTSHDWAQTFVILGFVFLGVALAILCAMVIIDSINQKNKTNTDEVSDDELLAKYKSKKTK
jgi:cell shape-determining protein MreD